jgi:chromosome partitioning protein
LIRLTISNQRGGVGKTTSAVTIARCLADLGKRVLLIDTDSQGSIAAVLGLKPAHSLYDLLIQKVPFADCIVPAHERVHVLCSNRYTVEAESALSGTPFREFTFEQVFTEHEQPYDAVIIDVAPSITLFQTCAMVYTQRILIPVDMDVLSVQGATSSIQAADTLNRMLRRGLNVQPLALLPLKVDRRLAMTDTVLNTLEDIGCKRHVPVLSSIRTDQTVFKASRSRQFLADHDPKCKALEDYTKATLEILEILRKEDAATHASAAE